MNKELLDDYDVFGNNMINHICLNGGNNILLILEKLCIYDKDLLVKRNKFGMTSLLSVISNEAIDDIYKLPCIVFLIERNESLLQMCDIYGNTFNHYAVNNNMEQINQGDDDNVMGVSPYDILLKKCEKSVNDQKYEDIIFLCHEIKKIENVKRREFDVKKIGKNYDMLGYVQMIEKIL
jgi:ankyrin repeat protein